MTIRMRLMMKRNQNDGNDYANAVDNDDGAL